MAPHITSVTKTPGKMVARTYHNPITTSEKWRPFLSPHMYHNFRKNGASHNVRNKNSRQNGGTYVPQPHHNFRNNGVPSYHHICTTTSVKMAPHITSVTKTPGKMVARTYHNPITTSEKWRPFLSPHMYHNFRKNGASHNVRNKNSRQNGGTYVPQPHHNFRKMASIPITTSVPQLP